MSFAPAVPLTLASVPCAPGKSSRDEGVSAASDPLGPAVPSSLVSVPFAPVAKSRSGADTGTDSVPPNAIPAEIPWRILYLFAGRQRQADLEDALRAQVQRFNDGSPQVTVRLAMTQVDTLRGGSAHDLLSEERQRAHLSAIGNGQYDLVLVAPPCNTFSRAVFSNQPGPRPIRDRMWPRGFPWLEANKRLLADEANNLVDFALDVLAATLEAPQADDWRRTRAWLEFPEDLGSAQRGNPASLWQFDAATKLKDTIFIRGAVHQCSWSPVDFSKPTGLITTVTTFLGAQGFYPGWPLFEETHDELRLAYVGPLPRKCAHQNHPGLIGRTSDGYFRTGATGAYHPKFCQKLAELFFADFCESFSTQVQACTPVAGIADAAGQDPIAPIPIPQPSALSLCSLVQKFKGDRQLLRGVSTTMGLSSGGGEKEIRGKEILLDGGTEDHLFIAKINLIIKSSLEGMFPAFSGTSFLINVNTTAEGHVDSGGEGQSALVVIGKFSGGEFMQERRQPIVIKDPITLFDGRRKHCSLSFQGTRISVVAYSHRVTGLLSKGMSSRLTARGPRLGEQTSTTMRPHLPKANLTSVDRPSELEEIRSAADLRRKEGKDKADPKLTSTRRYPTTPTAQEGKGPPVMVGTGPKRRLFVNGAGQAVS